MGSKTAIKWTDSTFNPWTGCQRVSPGCQHCYAEALAQRFPRFGRWGSTAPRVRTSAAYWRQPVRWDAEAVRTGTRRRVFCASLADVFEDRRDLDPWRADLFALIEATPHLDWQLLTKRPERVLDLVPPSWRDGLPRHVWIGASVEDQQRADERIPALLRVPAALRFLSVEPLLGPVDLDDAVQLRAWHEGIHWVIVGGESGPGARPCALPWIREVARQCHENGVPCFVKQLGSVVWVASTFCDEKWRPNDPKGGDPAEWPADLRVREMPVTT